MKKLDDFEALKLLKKFGISLVESEIVTTPEEAVDIAKKMGFPVVLKISSKDIIHKTDVGGVIVNLNTPEDVRNGFEQIISNVKRRYPEAKIDGVLVQRFLKDRTELVIGGKMDPQFGPVIMFGLGGIFVEVFRDVSFRIVPIAKNDAKEMIREIKAYPVLKGIRGKKPVNISKLEDMLLKVSKLLWKNQNILELDINPVLADEKDALAVDVRIIVN